MPGLESPDRLHVGLLYREDLFFLQLDPGDIGSTVLCLMCTAKWSLGVFSNNHDGVERSLNYNAFPFHRIVIP
jgi:hypothetical protein